MINTSVARRVRTAPDKPRTGDDDVPVAIRQNIGGTGTDRDLLAAKGDDVGALLCGADIDEQRCRCRKVRGIRQPDPHAGFIRHNGPDLMREHCGNFQIKFGVVGLRHRSWVQKEHGQ